MITEKHRRRARALAAHAASEGAEAEVARSMLAKLVEQHPGLSHWLEEGASDEVTAEFAAPTNGHRQILAEYVFRCRCEGWVEAVGSSGAEVVKVRGERARVRRVAEAYGPHADSLTLLFEALGAVYLEELVPELTESETDALLAEMDEEELKALAGLEPVAEREAPPPSEEEQRLERARAALPSAAITNACRKLVRLSGPARGVPSLKLGAAAVPWDSPEMGYEDFLRIYRAFFPEGEMMEYQLAQRYRDGFRIFPPTRGWRIVRPLSRPDDELPEKPDWWPV